MTHDSKRFKVSWVLVNELCVGPAPTKLEHLEELKSEGIVSILSLCGDNEAKIPLEIKEYFKVSQFTLPDHKYGKYPTNDEIKNVLVILENLLKDGPVFVHCFAGIERSPLICMAWLVTHHNMSVNDALIYMMSIHKRTNPLPKQLHCLYAFEL